MSTDPVVAAAKQLQHARTRLAGARRELAAARQQYADAQKLVQQLARGDAADVRTQPHVLQTVQLVQRGMTCSTQLAAALGISPRSAAVRLHRAWKAGLVERTRRGQYAVLDVDIPR